MKARRLRLDFSPELRRRLELDGFGEGHEVIIGAQFQPGKGARWFSSDAGKTMALT